MTQEIKLDASCLVHDKIQVHLDTRIVGRIYKAHATFPSQHSSSQFPKDGSFVVKFVPLDRKAFDQEWKASEAASKSQLGPHTWTMWTCTKNIVTGFIAMDFIEGTTLHNTILTSQEATELVRYLLQKLREFHQTYKWAHRDITADNIMISIDKKRAWLIDYDSAHLLQDAPELGTIETYTSSLTPEKQKAWDFVLRQQELKMDRATKITLGEFEDVSDLVDAFNKQVLQSEMIVEFEHKLNIKLGEPEASSAVIRKMEYHYNPETRKHVLNFTVRNTMYNPIIVEAVQRLAKKQKIYVAVQFFLERAKTGSILTFL